MSARAARANPEAGAARARLADGRWHFQHGPIDLILEAWGAAEECAEAYEQAWARFATVLPELVAELPLLRKAIAAHPASLSRASGREGAHWPCARMRAWRMGREGTVLPPGGVGAEAPCPHLPFADRAFALSANGPLLSRCAGEGQKCPLSGAIAKRMWNACAPFAPIFITPMAAVAGAVADEVIAAMIAGRVLRKAYVNNGGDIAIHLAQGERFETGIVGDLAKPEITATAGIAAADPVRGIATSGWRGRSFSLGIADAVTVLAQDAAAADAAATLVANAVNVEHPAILRRPARQLDPDSDLGDHLVTVEVGALDSRAIAVALARGQRVARAHREAGRIEAAYLELAGRRVAVGGESRRREVLQTEMAWSLRA